MLIQKAKAFQVIETKGTVGQKNLPKIKSKAICKSKVNVDEDSAALTNKNIELPARASDLLDDLEEQLEYVVKVDENVDDINLDNDIDGQDQAVDVDNVHRINRNFATK